jgi:hypothetical protein
MAGVRDRNESAWLLPNDGTRVNHRLRSDMRRYADADEVDLAVVGGVPAPQGRLIGPGQSHRRGRDRSCGGPRADTSVRDHGFSGS